MQLKTSPPPRSGRRIVCPGSSGGAGNRTRVRDRSEKASTSVARGSISPQSALRAGVPGARRMRSPPSARHSAGGQARFLTLIAPHGPKVQERSSRDPRIRRRRRCRCPTSQFNVPGYLTRPTDVLGSQPIPVDDHVETMTPPGDTRMVQECAGSNPWGATRRCAPPARCTHTGTPTVGHDTCESWHPTVSVRSRHEPRVPHPIHL